MMAQCIVFNLVERQWAQKSRNFSAKEGGEAGFWQILAQNLFEHRA